MVRAEKQATQTPGYVTEGAAIVKAFGTAPLYTLNLKQVETVFKSWLWQSLQTTPDPVAPTQYLTRAEAAERLHVSLVTLDKYCRTGILTRHKIGARFLLDEAEVVAAVTNKVR